MSPGRMSRSPHAAPPRKNRLKRQMRGTENALAVVRQLSRTQHLPAELIAVMDGKLADAVAVAADYAGDTSPRGPVPRIWATGAISPQWADAAGRSDGAADPPGGGRGLAGDAGAEARPQRAAPPDRGDRLASSQPRSRLAAGHAAIRQTLTGIAGAPRPVRPAAALTRPKSSGSSPVCAEDLRARGPRRPARPGAVSGRASPAPCAARSWSGSTSSTSGSRRTAWSSTSRAARATRRGRGPTSPCRACAARRPARWRALEAVAAARQDTRGPVFRRHHHCTARSKAVSAPTACYKILLRRAALGQADVLRSERLSPHGLRAGLITEASWRAPSDEQVMQHTRHDDPSTMRGYRRRARVTPTTRPGCSICERTGQQERSGLCPNPPRAGRPSHPEAPGAGRYRLAAQYPDRERPGQRRRAVPPGRARHRRHPLASRSRPRGGAAARPNGRGRDQARLLARELRAVIAARHERVLALGPSRGAAPSTCTASSRCPTAILRLGEDLPTALGHDRQYQRTQRLDIVGQALRCVVLGVHHVANFKRQRSVCESHVTSPAAAVSRSARGRCCPRPISSRGRLRLAAVNDDAPRKGLHANFLRPVQQGRVHPFGIDGRVASSTRAPEGTLIMSAMRGPNSAEHRGQRVPSMPGATLHYSTGKLDLDHRRRARRRWGTRRRPR